jgi:YesN/AraC family two-component response regulator
MARILIIEDDTRVRETYCLILEQAGYEVVTATDGKEGMRVFREKSPDLVITDIIMPEKEGLEVIRELKRDFPEVKIIAISGGGYAQPEDYLKTAKLFGAMCTLTKPIEQEELLEAVQECLT